VARSLAPLYGMVFGDGAVMSGWLARAQTLLGDAESPEAGWVALNIGMFDNETVRKNEHLRAALTIARRFGDTDLEIVSLAYLGASLVHADETEAGMRLLDESLGVVAGSEVESFQVLEARLRKPRRGPPRSCWPSASASRIGTLRRSDLRLWYSSVLLVRSRRCRSWQPSLEAALLHGTSLDETSGTVEEHQLSARSSTLTCSCGRVHLRDRPARRPSHRGRRRPDRRRQRMTDQAQRGSPIVVLRRVMVGAEHARR
jgi:hypothetical protein